MRFGPALRADLQQVYNVDMAQMFAEKRWIQLLALIDGLPPHSRYVQAMYADDDWMEMVSGGDEPSGDSAPPLSTWSPEVDMLAKVVDGLSVLTQTLIGVNGGKAKKVKPIPRPLTSSDQPTEFTEVQQSILDDFLPKTE